MKKCRKIIAMLSVAAMLTGCFGGCGKKETSTSAPTAEAVENTAVTELNYWTFLELHGNHFQDMCEKWNEAHPDRQIALNVNVLSYDDMHGKLQIALQSGKGAPDIVDIEIGKYANFLKGEPQLEPLNDMIDEYRDKLVESRIELYSKDGINYGVPSHVGATVCFYNTEILEAAGVNYEEIVTWEDFKKAGIKVKEETGKYMISADTGALWQLNVLLAQQGADWVDRDGDVNVNTPQAKKALEMLKELQELGIATTVPGGNPDTEEAYEYYNAGEVACAVMPLWQMSRYTSYMPDLEGKIAIGKVPVLEKNMPCSVGGGGTGTCITNQCVNVSLAKEFLGYAKLSTEGAVGLWDNLGFDPCNTDVWTMEEVTHNPDNIYVKYFVNNPFDVLNAMKDEICLVKSTDAYPLINATFCSVTLNSIFESDADIDRSLAEAQQQIESELQ